MKANLIHVVPSLTASRVKADGTSNVRLQINFGGRTAYIPLNVWVKPSQWNKRKFVINHPFANNLNAHIRAMVAQYEDNARQLQQQGGLGGLTAIAVRDKLLAMLNPQTQQEAKLLDVLYILADKATSKSGRDAYEITASKVNEWRGNDVVFSDINAEWLKNFEEWLKSKNLKHNSLCAYMRCIRRAFNVALRDELTTAHYPFREYTIKPEPVAVKSLTPEELRTLFGAEHLTAKERYWVDMLALSLCLIGINLADLYDITAIINHRINYTRKKTGRKYNIKVPSQAMRYIDKYAGNGTLVDIAQQHPSAQFATTACNVHLGKVARKLGLPPVTWYTARYSWATIAASLDISIDTISLALGHTYGKAVTLGYISQDYRKVDRANEQVLAEVFGAE